MVFGAAAGNARPWVVAVAAILGGALVALVATALMSKASIVWTGLVIAGVLVIAPTFIVPSARAYWFVLFVGSTLFEIKKTLLDGRAMNDYFGFYHAPLELLVPEIRLSDLPFAVLMGLWIWSLVRHRTTFRFPKHAWLAVALLAWTGLSVMISENAYLSLIEWARYWRFFLTYLWVVNNIDVDFGKFAVTILLGLLAAQSAWTLARYSVGFGMVSGSAFGRTQAADATHLVITSGGGGSGRRGYGTLLSPRGTAAHLLLLLPFPLLIASLERRWRHRLAYAGLAAMGAAALLSTFSRSASMALAVQLVLWLWLARLWGFVSPAVFRRLVALAVLCAMLAVPVALRFLYSRPENVTARSWQYRAALGMIRENPVFGVGLNNSNLVQSDYSPWTTTGVAIGDVGKASDLHPIHSTHLVMIAEIGILGFGLYAAFIGAAALFAVRLARSQNRAAGLLSGAMLLALIGMHLQGATDPLYESPLLVTVWFFVGWIDALREPSYWRSTGRPLLRFGTP